MPRARSALRRLTARRAPEAGPGRPEAGEREAGSALGWVAGSSRWPVGRGRTDRTLVDQGRRAVGERREGRGRRGAGQFWAGWPTAGSGEGRTVIGQGPGRRLSAARGRTAARTRTRRGTGAGGVEPRGGKLERGHGSETVSGPGSGQAPPGRPERPPPEAPTRRGTLALTWPYAIPGMRRAILRDGRKPWPDFMPLQRDRHAFADTAVRCRRFGCPRERARTRQALARSGRSFVTRPVSHERARSHPVVIVVPKVTPLAFEP